jgi:serine/threonine protein kinase
MASSEYPILLGNYVVVRPIAEDRSPDVYLAVTGQADEEEPCVLKVRRDPRRNIGAITKFAHENVARVIEVGRIGATVYLAAEHIHGHDLLSVWNRCAQRRVPIPVNVGAAIVVEVLRALTHIHEMGQVCSVLSPSKVLLSYEGAVKVVDCQAPRAFLRGPGIGASIGRTGYFAPEQLRGDPPSVAGDLFTLGVMLWELLAARPLFARSTSGTGRADHLLVEQYGKSVGVVAPPEPSKISRRVARELDPVVMRALAALPTARFPSAQAFRQALEGAVPDLGDGRAALASFLSSLYKAELAEEKRALDLAISYGRFMFRNFGRGSRPPLKAKLDSGPGRFWFGDDDDRPAPVALADRPVAPSAESGLRTKSSPLTASSPEPRSSSARQQRSRAATPARVGLVAVFLVGAVGAAIAWRRNHADAPSQASVAVAVPAASPVETTAVLPPTGSPSPPPSAAQPLPISADQPLPIVRAPAVDAAGRAQASEARTDAPRGEKRRLRHRKMDAETLAALIQKADTAWEIGDFKTAIALGREAAKNGGGERAYVIIGAASLRSGDLPAAREAFQASLRLNPNSHTARAGLDIIAEQEKRAGHETSGAALQKK